MYAIAYRGKLHGFGGTYSPFYPKFPRMLCINVVDVWSWACWDKPQTSEKTKEKSPNGVRSIDLGDQLWSPERKSTRPGYDSNRNRIVSRTVWHVELSCWNHMSTSIYCNLRTKIHFFFHSPFIEPASPCVVIRLQLLSQFISLRVQIFREYTLYRASLPDFPELSAAPSHIASTLSIKR